MGNYVAFKAYALPEHDGAVGLGKHDWPGDDGL